MLYYIRAIDDSEELISSWMPTSVSDENFFQVGQLLSFAIIGCVVYRSVTPIFANLCRNPWRQIGILKC